MYYHISENNNLKKMSPRVPSNFLTEEGFEDSETKRVSVSTSIAGALAAMSCNLKDETLYVYMVDDYNGRIVKTEDLRDKVPDAFITDECWMLSDVELKLVHQIKVKEALHPAEYTYGENKSASLWFWDYIVTKDYTDDTYTTAIKESWNIVQRANREYNVVCKTIEISESIGGMILILIPKLIHLIGIIISKIFYILSIPVIAAIFNHTKNIRRTGKKLIQGKTTLKQVGSSINFNAIRAAAASIPEGGAGIVKALNVLLEHAAKESEEQFKTDIREGGDFKESFKRASDTYVRRINDDANSMKYPIKNLINESYFKNMSEDELISDALGRMTMFSTGIVLEDYKTYKRTIQQRYNMNDMDTILNSVSKMIKDVSSVDTSEIDKLIKKSINRDEKVFDDIHSCYAKLNDMHTKYNFCDEHLLRNNYHITGDGNISSNLLENTYGDFVSDLKMKKIKGDIITKSHGFESFKSMTYDSFVLLAGGEDVDNREMSKRKAEYSAKIELLQKDLERILPSLKENEFSGKYIQSLLDFIRTDLLNRYHTILQSRVYLFDTIDNYSDTTADIMESLSETYYTFILHDIETNPEAYNIENLEDIDK